jgi:hypothetical protein
LHVSFIPKSGKAILQPPEGAGRLIPDEHRAASSGAQKERMSVTYFWVIPVVLLLIIAVLSFYAVIKRKGESGRRTPGRTVLDKTGEEPKPPGPHRPSET